MDSWVYLLLQAATLLINGNHFSYSSPLSANRFSGTSSVSEPDDNGQDFTVMDWISVANKPYNIGHEGDIALTDRDWNVYEKTRFRRNAVRQRKKMWPNRVIPYEIEEGLTSYKKNIMAAIEEFHKHTCITFKERKNERNWIKFSKDKGCWSFIGRLYWRKGAQSLSLGDKCNNKGIIMHELMHAVGFWHEQSRPDRDQFVEIIWENIKKGMESQFNKYKHSKVDSMDFDYDYSSLMHYGKRTFSKNGKATVRALNNPYMSLGRSVGFSDLDIKKMNALYDCKNEHKVGWSEWSAYTPCNSRCMKYRQRVCFSSRSHCPGADSHGVKTDRRKCPDEECYAPVNGNWGRWAEWDACDKPCGYGKRKRTRSCSDPAPKYGGKPCPGADTQNRMCNMMACPDNLADCNFDRDYCNWTNSWSSSPSFKWYRHRGSTPSRNTGPAADHGTSNGYYLYLESSYPARYGYKSQLMSHSFEPTEERCLSWWYSMNGRTVGSLNIYLINSRSGTKTSLWSKSGEQGKDWKQGFSSFQSDSQYRVRK
ncbi:hypothetical protein OS493_020694 [Desmophyllum pertusum]|uniref:Metalloendopeptidase n=2 Tax=Desmophyllum pertusum TaxID=174260 RepID=A0A9X0CK77_9CNID|nr:hypothetical protein OS493_020694 [Desmophyllum pertusum]